MAPSVQPASPRASARTGGLAVPGGGHQRLRRRVDRAEGRSGCLFHVLPGGLAVGVAFADLDGLPAALVGEPVPDLTTAATAEQAQLAAALRRPGDLALP